MKKMGMTFWLEQSCCRNRMNCYHARRGKMYGMLLESIQHVVREQYGEETWSQILEHAGIRNMVFTTHNVYKDEIMVNLAKSCSCILKNMTVDDCMNFFGTCFVDFCVHYGYDKVLRVAGRHYRDFLHGIDNLHEMMRFSYPKLQSPSFIVESEDGNGCILAYRSKRFGFKHYVIGQLKQCAKKFYNVDVEVLIIEETETENGCHVMFHLIFDNSVFLQPDDSGKHSGIIKYSFLSSSLFFKVFPFCILFDHDLLIKCTGRNISMLLGEKLKGFKLTEKFGLRRPLVAFTWENMMCLQKVIFELEYLVSIRRLSISAPCQTLCDSGSHTGHKKKQKLLFRGQMKFMQDWKAMAFLCNPLIGNLEDMQNVGLFINDLNMFDNSRDMVLAGWQHASQLEYSIEQQVEKSKQIEHNLEKLHLWRKKSDTLLYSMIPECIAKRLKNGEDPINTCETFEQVTIMFSYLVGFTEICVQASPMQIVECINNVFIVFDQVVDKYGAFKVETLGDAVYMVAGGVPDRKPDHAQIVAGLALELVEKAQCLQDPISGNSLQVRIGMHTGSVVAGVVGKRMPQYCLFGDTVNTASRMQSYSEPGRIHISEPCHECLKNTEFVTIYRGKVNVKGKGEMKTYWLAGQAGNETTKMMCEIVKWERCKHFHRHYRSFENGFDFHGMHASTSMANFLTNFDLPSDDDKPGSPGLRKESPRAESTEMCLSMVAPNMSLVTPGTGARRISLSPSDINHLGRLRLPSTEEEGAVASHEDINVTVSQETTEPGNSQSKTCTFSFSQMFDPDSEVD